MERRKLLEIVLQKMSRMHRAGTLEMFPEIGQFVERRITVNVKYVGIELG